MWAICRKIRVWPPCSLVVWLCTTCTRTPPLRYNSLREGILPLLIRQNCLLAVWPTLHFGRHGPRRRRLIDPRTDNSSSFGTCWASVYLFFPLVLGLNSIYVWRYRFFCSCCPVLSATSCGGHVVVSFFRFVLFFVSFDFSLSYNVYVVPVVSSTMTCVCCTTISIFVS